MKKDCFKFISWMLILLFVADAFAADGGLKQRRRQLKDIEETWRQGHEDIDRLSLKTLDDYVTMGLFRNPSLKGAFYKWKATVENISKQFSLPDPQFSYTDYIEEVETRVGPQQRAYSVKQMFPFADKLWIRRSKAFRDSEVAYYQFEDTRLGLIKNIADAFYEFAYLSKAILITRENVKLLRNFESVAQSKYSSGLTKNQDLLKIQVELGKLENELQSLEDLKNPVTIRLSRLLHLSDETALPRPDESLEDLSMEEEFDNVDELVETLLNQNPQLLAISQRIESEKADLKLARREYVPDLTLGVTHIDTADAVNPTVVDSGKDPLMVMVTFNVPLWFNRINAGIRQAEASLYSEEQMREGKKDDLISKLAMVHYKLRDARRQSRLYKDALIPKAVQTLNATKSAYEAGGMDFLSLIDAQRMLLNFQMAYYRHNADFSQRLYEMQSIIGNITVGDIYKGGDQ